MDVRTRLACQFALGNCLCMRRNHRRGAPTRPLISSTIQPALPSKRRGYRLPALPYPGGGQLPATTPAGAGDISDKG
jgi:hypothetical protein